MTPSAGDLDHIELSTVGVDVGSATTHLMLSRVRLARYAQQLSSRYAVVARDVIWKSPVVFTPYLNTETIDAAALRAYVDQSFDQAGVKPDDLDTGLVLLTGTALYRHNAHAIADSLAHEAGPFVFAAAGHRLEAALAAHGSGAVALSNRCLVTVVNVDIGGGTAKFALVADGQVRQTAAVLAGSRLAAWDAGRRLVRLEPAAALAAGHASLDLRRGERVSAADAQRLAAVLASTIVAELTGADETPLDHALRLTQPFEPPAGDWVLMLSGGVAECLAADGIVDHGDLGPALGAALVAELAAAGLADRIRIAPERLRATAIGISQFATQVSGATVHLPGPLRLPLHDVPVVCPKLDLTADPDADAVACAVAAALAERRDEPALASRVALAVRWAGPPAHDRIRAVADGITRGVAQGLPLLAAAQADGVVAVVLDADLAASLGRVLLEEAGWPGPALVCLDGLDVGELDFLDIGRPAPSGGGCPVVVKSLLFGDASDDRVTTLGHALARAEGGQT